MENTMDIRQEASENKFIACEGDDCGYIKYQETEGELDVLSTFVPPELRGGGRAATLTRFVLDYARKKGLKVVPTCSYTQLFLKRHSKDYSDLL